jgi:hypothetical protein
MHFYKMHNPYFLATYGAFLNEQFSQDHSYIKYNWSNRNLIFDMKKP